MLKALGNNHDPAKFHFPWDFDCSCQQLRALCVLTPVANSNYASKHLLALQHDRSPSLIPPSEKFPWIMMILGPVKVGSCEEKKPPKITIWVFRIQPPRLHVSPLWMPEKGRTQGASRRGGGPPGPCRLASDFKFIFFCTFQRPLNPGSSGLPPAQVKFVHQIPADLQKQRKPPSSLISS